jgi:mono/diheme cytochrome c family protein
MRLVASVAALLLVAVCCRADDVATGARLYAERCSGCHGDHGGGDGPAAAALLPKPRNFHDAAFWRDRALEQVTAIVKKGKPGTMMPGFEGVLSDQEIDAVARFVRTIDPGTTK